MRKKEQRSNFRKTERKTEGRKKQKKRKEESQTDRENEFMIFHGLETRKKKGLSQTREVFVE